MGENDEWEKEFRLDNSEAADFLREIADSLENEDRLVLKGGDWQIGQALGSEVPMRLFKDEEGLELGLKLLKKD